MFNRLLPLPKNPKGSFFLWGPRQAGKSFWLKHCYPNAVWIDLLQTDQYLRYAQRPSLLREEWLGGAYPKEKLVVLDEVQKVPALLDEVHWLIENQTAVFALCGSSARKLRRGHANLLGGRALRYEMHGLVSAEIGDSFDLLRALNHGNLPRHYLAQQPRQWLIAYIQDYLTEEIALEGRERRLPTFADFLRIAALSDAELVNFSNVARECGVSLPTAKEYFQILVDTLLGSFLPAYTQKPKRRVIQAPKFYFANVGVVNQLAQRGVVAPQTEVFGKALENWIHHELRAYLHYTESALTLHYWRLASGIEVDFVLSHAQGIHTALEIKGSQRVGTPDAKGLRELAVEHPQIQRRILLCLEEKRRQLEPGIEIWPVGLFLQALWAGNILPTG